MYEFVDPREFLDSLPWDASSDMEGDFVACMGNDMREEHALFRFSQVSGVLTIAVPDLDAWKEGLFYHHLAVHTDDIP